VFDGVLFVRGAHVVDGEVLRDGDVVERAAAVTAPVLARARVRLAIVPRLEVLAVDQRGETAA